MDIKFLWNMTNIKGSIAIENAINGGRPENSASVDICPNARGIMTLSAAASEAICGSGMTRLHVESNIGSFTVRTADISMAYPVHIPEYHVVVTEGRDGRSFDEIVADIRGRGLRTEMETMEEEAEETYEHAARENLSLHGPAWLGLGRDMRLFSADMRQSEDDPWAWVEPRYAGSPVELPENDGGGVRYQYTMGRGIGCAHDYSRRLHDGALPILMMTVRDKEVLYETTVFASLEKSPLTPENNRGTHYLAADRYGAGHCFTPEQEKRAEELLPGELARDEETVAYTRTVIRNTGGVPRHGWYKAPYPSFSNPYSRALKRYHYDEGYGQYGPERIFCAAKIDGDPLPQEEISVLIAPGEEIHIDAFIPHGPVSRERAQALMEQDFEARLAECVAYWEQREQQGSLISVPEETVHEMIRAGLFHLDISTYGLEPGGTLSPTIGIYSALASESWPIVLYFESMGWHDVAARCIQYFYDKQHEDGFMQNFGQYMLETGAALWFTAEHFLHTRDEAWLRGLMPGIRKAVDYLLAWRERSKREELRGREYGMLEGRSSDTPDDEQRMYLLNSLTYKGLDQISRVCRPLDEAYWGPVCDETAAYREDIRVSVADNMARGPVVPLDDGTWCPTLAPWAGGDGPVSLLNDGKNWYTHGMFVARDAHMHQFIFCGILDPDELFAEFIMNYHCEMLYIKNVRPSQPYYSRHPYVHLLRGESKAFIRNYYNGLTSLADRETYSFWEHYFHASPHKTHEEGCFLMESRWMLYLEDGDTLRLLMGVPGKWMENGKRIAVTDASSHFGHLSLTAASRLNEGRITVDVEFADPARLPREILLRIPHPEWKAPTRVEDGVYDEQRKYVIVHPVKKQFRVTAHFG